MGPDVLTVSESDSARARKKKGILKAVLLDQTFPRRHREYLRRRSVFCGQDRSTPSHGKPE